MHEKVQPHQWMVWLVWCIMYTTCIFKFLVVITEWCVDDSTRRSVSVAFSVLDVSLK